MRILLAQINPIVGDLVGNTEKLKDACIKGNELNASLIITPELSLWGYPPRDLLFNHSLLKLQNQLIEEIRLTIHHEAKNISILVGIAERANDDNLPDLFNSIILINKSSCEIKARKQLLPEYDIFDEKRYFRKGDSPNFFKLNINNEELNIGLTICEDIWVEKNIQEQRIAGEDPIEKLRSRNIDLLINLSASPFSKDKKERRNEIAKKASERLNCPMIYLNQVGSNDELIFDGSSFILDQNSQSILMLPSFKEEFTIWDTKDIKQRKLILKANKQEELFQALILGVKDYSKKCGFKSSLLGLSGGIDSALVSIIAAAALGPRNLTAVLMPSPWSSSHSVKDALALAKRINCLSKTIPIRSLMEAFDNTLREPLGETPQGITAENLQSRIRGILLMGIANQTGSLLLSTGNKSELAVGYCTLYGDMNGGLAVIGDLYKTEVFELCAWIDSDASKLCRGSMGLPLKGDLIGAEIRNKAPSAELSPGQLDSDSLPNYAILDLILASLIEKRESPEKLIMEGLDPETVQRVINLLKKGEFKRYQAPPLLKVSNQAFGSGWRRPIASK